MTITSHQSRFTRFSAWTAKAAGQPAVFGLALIAVVVWGASGPLFHFSDTWQLVINPGTTIITFLMVFLIQNTQNRDSEALHIKLDELIRSHREANNSLLDLDKLDEKQLARLRARYRELAADDRVQLDR